MIETTNPMTQTTNETASTRTVLLLCSRRRCKERNLGEPTASSNSGFSDWTGVGRVRGVDIVSMMDVSVRNDDMPSISPSDGSLMSSPKLFLSRYDKNDALHSGHVLALGFTCVSHLWHLPRIWAIPETCRATVHNCLVVGPRRIVLRPNSP